MGKQVAKSLREEALSVSVKASTWEDRMPPALRAEADQIIDEYDEARAAGKQPIISLSGLRKALAKFGVNIGETAIKDYADRRRRQRG